MRIPDIITPTVTRQDSAPGRSSGTGRTTTAPADSQQITLPTVSELNRAGETAREAHLADLKESLRSGEYRCEPEQVAQAILARGLENL
jgi:anti-sigma28 factor (negative regulator of flagellin synthesis)